MSQSTFRNDDPMPVPLYAIAAVIVAIKSGDADRLGAAVAHFQVIARAEGREHDLRAEVEALEE